MNHWAFTPLERLAHSEWDRRRFARFRSWNEAVRWAVHRCEWHCEKGYVRYNGIRWEVRPREVDSAIRHGIPVDELWYLIHHLKMEFEVRTYRISKEHGKYVVRKEWSGKKIGTHDTKEKAQAQIHAIYAHEGK